MKTLFAMLTVLLCLSAAQATLAIVVEDIEAFDRAVASLQPGDEIVLANGIWRDVELIFRGQGSADQPITLRAQEPGKVLIVGQSNLGLSGKHLHVHGLVFKDGFTPTSEVIAFRTSNNDLASHSQVTHTVIDNFSNPERYSADTWVALYGKNNRFAHNTLTGKGNSGVTLAIKMNTKESQQNGHIVEYNYFGPRQTLGSNGGETLRIGTSHHSRAFSNSFVRYNYFDRTSGELEIISSKSCGNTISQNVFFESQGTLTMRHGHYTTVEGNYFLGNRKPNTGGIRVINENQTVQHNYLSGLTGHRFRGALVVMNGVPNGPINRYDPVIDSVLNNNIVVDSDHIQLCAGSDTERSAPPIRTTMNNNVFMTRRNKNLFTVYDDISGISFANNIIAEGIMPPTIEGFTTQPYHLERDANGLMSPTKQVINVAGFSELRLPVTREQVGASFYSPSADTAAFRSGKTVIVTPGTNTLVHAIKDSEPGDVLQLANGGEYLMTKLAVVSHPITITSEPGDKPVLHSEKSHFFVIDNGGSLELDNLWLDGKRSPDIAGNSAISTSRYSMNRNYSLVVRNCLVTNLDVNHSFHFLRVSMSTFADLIEISNTTMQNISGSILSLNKETDDLGIYNVENLIVRDNQFTDVQGAVIDVYRGGTDESTFGPIVTVENNRLTRVGLGKRNKAKASMAFHGVQKLIVADSLWEDSAPLALHLTNGEPITRIDNIVLRNSGKIQSNSDQYSATNVTYE